MSINIDHQQNTISSSNKTITVDHTGSLVVPKGTTAERPSAPTDGAIRYNTDLTQLEVLISSNWEKVQAGAGGALTEGDAIAFAIALGG